jgi:hypothetical protein
MLYREIITVDCDNHTKHINIPRVNSMKVFKMLKEIISTVITLLQRLNMSWINMYNYETTQTLDQGPGPCCSVAFFFFGYHFKILIKALLQT